MGTNSHSIARQLPLQPRVYSDPFCVSSDEHDARSDANHESAAAFITPQPNSQPGQDDFSFDWTYDTIEPIDSRINEDDFLPSSILTRQDDVIAIPIAELVNDSHGKDSILVSHGQTEILATGSTPHAGNFTMSLLRFAENISHWLTVMEDLEWEGPVLVQECVDTVNTPAENPAAQVLASTKELCNIVQSLTSCRNETNNPRSRPLPASQTEPVSTQLALLILSGHLQLMQLYDVIFSRVHASLSKMLPEDVRNVRVKAVLKIAGDPLLQDVSGPSYAKLIVDMMKSQIQRLEELMGLPARYCLLGANDSTGGLFANTDLEDLVHTVMTRKDVKSPNTVGASHAETLQHHMEGILRMLES
jgi:hypothetical protein